MTSELGRSFAPDVLELLERDVEVRIETHSAAGERHRTTIWSVVDAGDVFIRSYNGASARWYREILVDPDPAIVLDGGRRVAIRISSATAAEEIARCSRALQAKYRDDPATPAMVRPEVLETTLRVEPA